METSFLSPTNNNYQKINNKTGHSKTQITHTSTSCTILTLLFLIYITQYMCPGILATTMRSYTQCRYTVSCKDFLGGLLTHVERLRATG